MIIEKHKANSEREICLCGLPIVQYGTKKFSGFNEKYCDISPKSFEHKALDMILEFIPKHKNHDHIWIVRTNGIGDALILNYMMSELRKKWKFKNPCFISHRTIYKQMFELYSDIPFYPMNLKHDDYAFYLKKRNVKYKGKYFHIHHCTIDESAELIKKWKFPNHDNALYTFLEMAGVKNLNYTEPVFTEDVKISALEKIKKINLNINNFIFISPEASSTTKIEQKFWQSLTYKFQKRGYDVYINTANGNTTFGKSTNLNIAEAMYISSLAKRIIALASGFAECLATIKRRNKLDIIYYYFLKSINPEQFLQIFSLKDYPFYNPSNTCELVVNDNNLGEILNYLTNMRE